MFVFGLRPSTIDSMSEGSLSQVWEMPAIAPTAQNRCRADARRWFLSDAAHIPVSDTLLLSQSRLVVRRHIGRQLMVSKRGVRTIRRPVADIRLATLFQLAIWRCCRAPPTANPRRNAQ